MTITLKEFQELSTRTAPFNAAPENHIEKQNILTNYTLGLNGEFIELELENNSDFPSYSDELIKEAGDVLHYAVVLLRVLNKKTTDESTGLKIVSKKNVKESLGNTLEIIKKTYYHGHEFNEKEYVKSVKTVIDYIYDQLGEENFYIALERNIDKLKKRYPDGFSKESSIKRVDVEEK